MRHRRQRRHFDCRKSASSRHSSAPKLNNKAAFIKKYRRAVNTIDGTCAVLGLSCVATGAVGAGLLASGVGFVPGLALEAVTGVAGLLDVAGVVVSRRCSRKVAKHEAVRILASSKLNTVHSHISKALEECGFRVSFFLNCACSHSSQPPSPVSPSAPPPDWV